VVDCADSVNSVFSHWTREWSGVVINFTSSCGTISYELCAIHTGHVIY